MAVPLSRSVKVHSHHLIPFWAFWCSKHYGILELVDLPFFLIVAQIFEYVFCQSERFQLKWLLPDVVPWNNTFSDGGWPADFWGSLTKIV